MISPVQKTFINVHIMTSPWKSLFQASLEATYIFEGSIVILAYVVEFVDEQLIVSVEEIFCFSNAWFFSFFTAHFCCFFV